MEILTEKHSHVSKAATLIFRYEWTIQNFPMCQKKNGEWIKSPVFSFSNCDYSIDLYPCGIYEITDYLSIFLNIEKKSSDFNEELSFYFSVLNNENEIIRTEKIKKKSSADSYGRYGILKFLDRDEVLDPSNDILDNHALTIVCEFYTNSAMRKFADEDAIDFQKCKNQYSLYNNLQSMLNNRRLTDVTLVVNEKEFPAHKLILMARSPVFAAAMLENDTKKKINLEDVEIDVIEKMLEFMYTDKVINMNDFYPKLLYVARKYDIEGLKLACEEFAFNNLTVDNAVEVLTLCESYECEVLKPKVLKFIIKNAKKMIDHKQFDVWAKDLPQSLVDVIKAIA